MKSGQVKAAVASLGIHGVTLGVMSAGTAFNLIHNWLNRGGLAHQHIGQAGQVTGALVEAAKAYGAEIRLNAEVTSIKVKNGRTTGVVLANGEEIAAQTVLSAADPKRTFLSLVGPMELPPTFVWNVQSIKIRGSVAKVHLGVDSLPDGMTPNTTYVFAPSIRYLEKAYDAAKYGEISEKPYLEVTTTENVVSIHFQFAPYKLKDKDWQVERKQVENLAIDALSEHFPNLKLSIANRKSLTPARSRIHLRPDRRRPQPRTDHARPVLIHAPHSWLVEPQNTNWRVVSLWQRCSCRRWNQWCEWS